MNYNYQFLPEIIPS